MTTFNLMKVSEAVFPLVPFRNPRFPQRGGGEEINNSRLNHLELLSPASQPSSPIEPIYARTGH